MPAVNNETCQMILDEHGCQCGAPAAVVADNGDLTAYCQAHWNAFRQEGEPRAEEVKP